MIRAPIQQKATALKILRARRWGKHLGVDAMPPGSESHFPDRAGSASDRRKHSVASSASR